MSSVSGHRDPARRVGSDLTIVARLTKERWDKIAQIMGIWPDASISRVYGVDRHIVARERKKRGIAPYPKEDVFLAAGRKGTKARGDGYRKDVLGCLWPTLPSTSGEVHERMERSHGQTSHRHVIRTLQDLVRAGKAKRVETNGTVGYILGKP